MISAPTPGASPTTAQRAVADIRARLMDADGIGWGDPFCVTPCEPDRDCEIDDCQRDAVWSVEAMGCHYDGEAPEQGPTADACATHVSTLMERWT